MLGNLLTAVYLRRTDLDPRRLGIGPDSLAVLVLYALGIIGLAVIGG